MSERALARGEVAGAEGQPATGEYFGDILERRLARRSFLKGAAAAGVGLTLAPSIGVTAAFAGDDDTAVDPGVHLGFTPVKPSFDDAVLVPEGYSHNIILRWGDPLFPDAYDFDLNAQSGRRQAQQFGFNCDFIGFFPLPFWFRRYVERFGPPNDALLELLAFLYPTLSRHSSRQALLAVNHEYTTGSDMFPGYDGANPTQDQCETEIAAHGASIVHIRQMEDGAWSFVKHSPFNRRITGTSRIAITGPLRGHAALKTGYDPDAKFVRGMFNNCAGGKTPWGTVLSCEENFDQYFANFAALDPASPQHRLSARIPAEDAETDRKWERFDPRFDLAREPNEYARFGYVVEIDPYDSESLPKKRTALGRFKHEAAVPALTHDRRVAIYSGDDARFEYVYKFITEHRYKPHDRRANMTLLNRGTLYVAKFFEDGTGAWLPLVHGQGPLVEANGFPSQAEVLINTRGAADLVGATKMDRPEDVDVSPTTGKIYVAFTNNTSRTGPSSDAGEDAANPRAPNPHGHIIEIEEEGGDHGSLSFKWEIFILCGDPTKPEHKTFFAGFDPSRVSPIAAPDNLVFDRKGNLWVATDGQIKAQDFGWNDGVFAVPVEGADRGFLRQFLSGVPGGEICGPEFSGDNRTFFCGIQHPGEDAGLPNATSAWPDGNNPPKPSVIAVRHNEGAEIGS